MNFQSFYQIIFFFLHEEKICFDGVIERQQDLHLFFFF